MLLCVLFQLFEIRGRLRFLARECNQESATECRFRFLYWEGTIVSSAIGSTAMIEIYFTHVARSGSISGGCLLESVVKAIHLRRKVEWWR